jgi:predicted DCC family thiol-disulfide oxidoreductase YuxK
MIVLYDEGCGFCQWTVAWALKRDTRDVLRPEAIQSPTGARMLADLDPASRLQSMHVVHETGRRESGGAALRAVLETLPSTRLAARVLSRFPRTTDHGYAFVARHRRHFGRLTRTGLGSAWRRHRGYVRP